MTAVWGPLGWMTLHSVATCYSETPTESEKALMNSWLGFFRDTITCSTCRDHFTEMLEKYRRAVPGFLSSRQEFVLATFRMHNTVNRRLSKPIYNSVEECMATLRQNVQYRSAQVYRTAYLDHIQNYWRTLRDAAGFAALRKIVEMRKIETNYILEKDTNFVVDIQSSTTVFPPGVLDKMPESIQRAIPVAPVRNMEAPRMRLTANGFRRG